MNWVPVRSLRGKIGAAALAVLVSSVAITCLMLDIATRADEVIGRGQQVQERLRVYTQLQEATRDYHGAAYLNVRDPDAESARRVTETRTRLTNLLSEVSRLPAADQREAAAAEKIVQQSHVVIEHFRNTEVLVAQVDQRWQQDGSRAALQEVERLTRPIYDLRDSLKTEIRLGTEEMRIASSNTRSLIERSVDAALVGLMLAVFFSGVLYLLLARRLTPGLVRLEQGANAVGQGKLDHRINLEGADELATLSRAFDTMAASLAEQRQSLRKAQDGLEIAVAERTAELELANGKLAEVDGRRRAFMADVSHELRTPLTIIRGEAQIALKLHEAEGSEPPEVLEHILQQTDDLTRMVDDLFLIARAEAGVLSLERETVDLGELGEAVAADFNTIAHETGSSISTSRHGPVPVAVDANRIRRAIAALIENALKHCERGVQIEVTSEVLDDQAVITVSDNGCGLGDGDSSALLKRFHRGNTHSNGSGLGLSLVKAIAEAHGGSIALGTGQDGGTGVTIRLPVAALAREAA